MTVSDEAVIRAWETLIEACRERGCYECPIQNECKEEQIHGANMPENWAEIEG